MQNPFHKSTEKYTDPDQANSKSVYSNRNVCLLQLKFKDLYPSPNETMCIRTLLSWQTYIKNKDLKLKAVGATIAVLFRKLEPSFPRS